MRVLHALHNYLPRSRGGVETYVEMLVQALAGHSIEGQVLFPTEVDSEPTRHGVVQLHSLPWVDPVESSLGRANLEQATAITRLLIENRIDLLHVHHWHGLGHQLVRAAAQAGVPAVVSIHDYFPVCPLLFRRRWGRICEAEQPIEVCTDCLVELLPHPRQQIESGLAFRNAQFLEELRVARRILAISEDQARMLRSFPLLAGLPILTPGFPSRMGPDLGRPPLRWQPPEPLQLVTWGGLVEGKGLHLIVEAALELPPGAVEIHHHGRIIEEPYRAGLADRAAGVPLTFHGPYEPKEMADWRGRYHLAVHPSLFLETYGFTTDEALGLGLPVIVPDRGAPRERIGGRGTTFTFGSSASLASQLRAVLQAPALLEDWAVGAPGPSQSLGEHAEVVASLYADVLAGT